MTRRARSMTLWILLIGLTVVFSTAGDAAESVDDQRAPKCLFIDWGSVYDHLGLDDPRKPITVSGTVSLDAAPSGTTAGGIAGVSVSDGRRVTKTDKNGAFALHDVVPGLQRFVFVTVPSGYRIGGDFYRRIPSDTDDMTVHFSLRPDPDSLRPGHSFVQITDSHGDTRFVAELTPKLGAFAVLTGDLVNSPYDQTGFFRVRDALTKSAIPIMPLPGNHDVLAGGSGEIVTRRMLRERREQDKAGTPRQDADAPEDVVYEDVFGPSHYSFGYGNRHYVLLLSSAERDRQEEWIRNDIAAQPDGIEVLIFQHYPPNPDQITFYGQFNIRAVFSGHTHADMVCRQGKILNVNTMAIGGSRDFSPSAIRVVTFSADGIHLENHSPGFGNQADIPMPAVVAGAAATVKIGSDWPTFMGSSARTGAAREAMVPPFAVAWTRSMRGTAHVGAPVIAAGRLYVGLGDKENRDRAGVYALDPATGEDIWRYRTASGAAVTFADGTLYAAVQDGSLHAFDPATGNARWVVRIEDPTLYRLHSSPSVCSGLVMAGNGKHFGAFDRLTGKPVWRVPDIGAGFWANFAAPAVSGGRVLIMVPGRGILAFDAASGREVWRAETVAVDTRNPFTPAIHGNTVYAASNRGLHALDAETGEARWTAQTIGLPAVDDAGVFVATRQGFARLNPESGQQVWVNKDVNPPAGKQTLQFHFPSPVFAAPVISGSFVHVATTRGQLVSMSRETGETAAVLELGMPFVASPAVSGNALFLVSYNGTVIALTPAVAGKGK